MPTNLILACLLFCADTSVRVQEAPTFQLSGPTTLTAPGTATFIVTGLPAVDLTKPIGEQTKWVDAFRIDVSSPENTEAQIRKKLAMGVSPWAWELELTLTTTTTGVYVIVCDWNEPPYGLALHRLSVGQGSDPPKPPVIPAATKVLILLEANEQAIDQALLINQCRNESSWSKLVTVLDQNMIQETGQPDPQVQQILSALNAAPLPQVVLLNNGGAYASNFPLPKTWNDLKNQLQAKGIKP